ncbi:hypothetical protein LTR56_027958, partial [Elasticomyces elasticus]
ASATVGDMEKLNIACGRHLAFYLDKLIGRIRDGATKQSLENDEEMLAYASGDMQGSAEESWVWAGSETGANLTQMPGVNGRSPGRTTPPHTQMGSDVTRKTRGPLSEKELQEWGGWENVQRKIQVLLQEQQQQGQQLRQEPTQSTTMSPMPPPLPHQQQPLPLHQYLHPQRSPTYPPHPAFERPNSKGMPQFAPASYQSNASPLPSNEASTSRISIRDIM